MKILLILELDVTHKALSEVLINNKVYFYKADKVPETLAQFHCDALIPGFFCLEPIDLRL